MENEELENTEVQAPISEEIVENPETNTQESTATLADTIKKVDQSTLPPFLQFHEDPSLIKTKIEDMYESKEAITGLYKLLEAKGTRQAITRYLIDTKDNPEIRSYDDFNNRGYNDSVNITRSTYTEEIKLYKEGAYGKNVYALTGEKRDEKTGEVLTVDSRPDFNAEQSSDKIESEIFNVMSSINNRTKSVEESVADKYEEVYDAVYVIASEKSVNRHAIICGEAGCGKTTMLNYIFDTNIKSISPNDINFVYFPNIPNILLIDTPGLNQCANSFDMKKAECNEIKRRNNIIETIALNTSTFICYVTNNYNFKEQKEINKLKRRLCMNDNDESKNKGIKVLMVIHNKPKITTEKEYYDYISKYIITDKNRFKMVNNIIQENITNEEIAKKIRNILLCIHSIFYNLINICNIYFRSKLINHLSFFF